MRAETASSISDRELLESELGLLLRETGGPQMEEKFLLRLARRLRVSAHTPLQLAISNGHAEVAERLLPPPGMVADAGDGGALTAVAAAWLDALVPFSLPVLNLLLARGLPIFAAGLLPRLLQECLALGPAVRSGANARAAEAPSPLRALSRVVGSAIVDDGVPAPSSIAALPPREQLQLLHAAVVAGFTGISLLILRELSRQPDASQRWASPKDCADVWVEAAAQGLTTVLEELLAVEDADGGHPFSPGMWSEPAHGDGEEPPATALMVAARGGHLPVLRLLLERGTPVNLADEAGAAALHYAVAAGELEAAELLLDWGARCPTLASQAPTQMRSAAPSGATTRSAITWIGHCSRLPCAARCRWWSCSWGQVLNCTQ